MCDGRYAAVGRLLLKLALQANDAGAHFPVWGTCLGYEQLAIAVADDCSILGHFDAEDDAGCARGPWTHRDGFPLLTYRYLWYRIRRCATRECPSGQLAAKCTRPSLPACPCPCSATRSVGGGCVCSTATFAPPRKHRQGSSTTVSRSDNIQST